MIAPSPREKIIYEKAIVRWWHEKNGMAICRQVYAKLFLKSQALISKVVGKLWETGKLISLVVIRRNFVQFGRLQFQGL